MAYNDRIPSHTHYITPGYSTCAFAKQSRTPHPFFHIYTVGMCGVRYQLGTSYYGYLLIYSVVEKTQITCQAGALLMIFFFKRFCVFIHNFHGMMFRFIALFSAYIYYPNLFQTSSGENGKG